MFVSTTLSLLLGPRSSVFGFWSVHLSSQEYARQLEERHTLRQLRTRVDALKKGYAWSLVTDAEDALEQVMSSHNARVEEHCEASDAEEKVRGEQAELRGECEAKQAHLDLLNAANT